MTHIPASIAIDGWRLTDQVYKKKSTPHLLTGQHIYVHNHCWPSRFVILAFQQSAIMTAGRQCITAVGIAKMNDRHRWAWAGNDGWRWVTPMKIGAVFHSCCRNTTLLAMLPHTVLYVVQSLCSSQYVKLIQTHSEYITLPHFSSTVVVILYLHAFIILYIIHEYWYAGIA